MSSRKLKYNILIIAVFGLVPAITCQFINYKPVSRDIHISNFRYGKDPSVIRCHRGDTLNLTFSTEDTGHSFFLEEFDIDAKISPSRDFVEVFKTSDPTREPYRTQRLTFIAKHSGIRNFFVSKSIYRCHVWCGPMHAFESGKLIIMPNTLLMFSLGCVAGILFLWIISFFRGRVNYDDDNKNGYKDLLGNDSVIRKILVSRWAQIILTII
ncbi:MAG: hypothetical protein GT600_09680, partial [Bacteroidales bacterium]|nr:hypothetical protein [Bacteroidales bacterium]